MRQAFVLQSMARAGRGAGLPLSTTELGTWVLLSTWGTNLPLIQGMVLLVWAAFRDIKKGGLYPGNLETEMLCIIQNTDLGIESKANPNPWLSTAVTGSC